MLTIKKSFFSTTLLLTFHCSFLLCCCVALFSCNVQKKAVDESTEVNTKPSARTEKKIAVKYSELLGIDASKIENTALYSFIDSWYGTSYKYNGDSKKGIDCSNFTKLLYATVYQLKLEVPAGKIYSMCKPIATKELHEGDLVFFKIDSKDITHVGVYLQNTKFVHASSKKGIMISSLDEPYFKKYFYKAARIKNDNK